MKKYKVLKNYNIYIYKIKYSKNWLIFLSDQVPQIAIVFTKLEIVQTVSILKICLVKLLDFCYKQLLTVFCSIYRYT
jgi:hypothetical protein